MSGNWASKFSRSGSSPSPCVPVTRTSVLTSSSRAGKASIPDGFFSGLAGWLSEARSAPPAARSAQRWIQNSSQMSGNESMPEGWDGTSPEAKRSASSPDVSYHGSAVSCAGNTHQGWPSRGQGSRRWGRRTWRCCVRTCWSLLGCSKSVDQCSGLERYAVARWLDVAIAVLCHALRGRSPTVVTGVWLAG